MTGKQGQNGGHRWSGAAGVALALVLLVVLIGRAGVHAASQSDVGLEVGRRQYLPYVKSPKEIVDQGDIFGIEEEFASVTIEAGKVHRWTVEIFAGEVLGFPAIAAAPADLVLSLVKDGRPIINRQNNAPPGVAEMITSPVAAPPGLYEILVETAYGSAAEYAISRFDNNFPLVFKGFLTSGASKNSVRMPAQTTHYWFFTAGAGNRLSATLTPDKESDIYADFFAPGAKWLESLDMRFEGEAEQLSDLLLPANGLYAVRVEDLDYTSMIYDIVIHLQE